MPEFRALPLAVRFETVATVDVDLLAIPVFEQDDPAAFAGDLDNATISEWMRASATRELCGKPFEQVVVTSPGVAAGRVLLVGAGAAASFGGEMMRRVAAAAGLAARQRRAPRVALLLRGLTVGNEGDRLPERIVQAAAEGLTLAQLDTAFLKTGDRERIPLAEVTLVVSGSADAMRQSVLVAAERGRILGECANQARALGNEPANRLTPRVFAERARALAEGTGLGIEVLDEAQIAALGMGLLLGVANGSHEPPRVVVLRHEPVGVAEGPVLGLVGKGITFDTGGISIKPADGMERMKVDMGGGAAVVGAMRALALTGARIRALGVVPLTENMPGGGAMRPGDILSSAAGKTVEVINTDAEGRLVLGDGLWLARSRGATHLVDVATLTGACVVALGRGASGLFGAPDDWTARVREAASLAGERCWPMPLFDDYFEQLKSEAADMTNTGGRAAGAVTAALFLKQFAGDLPWAHLDIAGTAWADEPKPWQARGATGFGVRTLAELALGLAG
jgi:leucyl aminopeptidase